MSERLADWFGPENIPIRIPASQKKVFPVIINCPTKGTESSNKSRLGLKTAIKAAIIRPILLI